MKSVVTGSKGFIGKKLCSRLKEEGHQVLELNKSHGDLTVVSLEDIVSEKDKEIIFHLASETFVPESWQYPEKFITKNILSTLSVLEYCRKHKSSLVFLSAYIYGSQISLPVSEDAEINSSNPYALSKHLSEELCKSYSEMFDLNITIIRPFNVYGVGQNSSFLIPQIVDQIKERNFVEVQSFKPKRDYIHVDDVIEGIILSSKALSSLQIYNLGYGESFSVYQIIEIISEIIGRKIDSSEQDLPRNNEIKNVVADISKAKDKLGWKPKIKIKEGLREILIKEKLC